MSRRFFDDSSPVANKPLLLGEFASHHISRVLRMQPGEEVVIFNGRGGEWQARIEDISRQGVTLIPLVFVDKNRAPGLNITLALPLIKGDRMDYALQKSTELGVTGFQLIQTQRQDVRLDGQRLEKKLRHWHQVIISACEQCGLNRLPYLKPPESLETVLAGSTASLQLVAHPEKPPLGRLALKAHRDLLLFTGPEGGFTHDELALVMQAEGIPFSFGQTVLRAETAPAALVSAILALTD